ncbi:MAG: zinc ribbon domain-containing protein [Ktedonobacteraceae bacterium]
MAQNPPRLCPNCGTPAEPNQRFCAECGTTLSMVSNHPTALASGEQQAIPMQGAQYATQPEAGNGASGNTAIAPTQLVGTSGQAPAAYPASTVPSSGAQFYAQTTDVNPIAPPPPPDSLVAPLYQPSYQAPEQVSSPDRQPTPAPGTYVVPDYARVPRRSRAGLIVSLVLLLVLVLGGVAAYALFFHKSNSNNQGNQGSTPPHNTPVTNANTPVSNVTATTGTNNGSTPGSGSTTPTTTANGATSEQVNLVFTYAGINFTINSVQYAASFPDDSNLSAGGVRVAFNENNAITSNPDFLYSDVSRLILSDHSSVAPTNESHPISPDSQTTRSNWLDFPVTSQPADLSQLILQMGTATENQMQIPLSAGADLSKYQAKTVTPGTQFQYAGLNWTLKSATESLSAGGRQATSGNVYVTVTLDVFNPTSNGYSAYYGDIARLSVGGATSSPTSDSNFPTSVASQTNATGTLIFLVPQGNTSYTLVMLAVQSSPPIQQKTVPFTIQ